MPRGSDPDRRRTFEDPVSGYEVERVIRCDNEVPTRRRREGNVDWNVEGWLLVSVRDDLWFRLSTLGHGSRPANSHTISWQVHSTQTGQANFTRYRANLRDAQRD